ncbi:hypothetical protein [Amycolatopsis taiwanensis]|uniref:hypothetical protein n=1 Tax=Amycolatopsis taiwanensis TaxID=342230 RepID=UPI000482C61A|nr:hypothetical protein [Amycolatopsis taiwanensis]
MTSRTAARSVSGSTDAGRALQEPIETERRELEENVTADPEPDASSFSVRWRRSTESRATCWPDRKTQL